jgi:hypothetical protein
MAKGGRDGGRGEGNRGGGGLQRVLGVADIVMVAQGRTGSFSKMLEDTATRLKAHLNSSLSLPPRLNLNLSLQAAPVRAQPQECSLAGESILGGVWCEKGSQGEGWGGLMGERGWGGLVVPGVDDFCPRTL